MKRVRTKCEFDWTIGIRCKAFRSHAQHVVFMLQMVMLLYDSNEVAMNLLDYISFELLQCVK